jgi:response regulator RpfG family c-di-GMP phosphodiesterase
MNDDAILWTDEPENLSLGPETAPWRLLVVDDEDDVHAVTALALGGLVFNGRGIELLSARTGVQAVEVLRAHPDVALVLLDVVMETDDAGLRTVVAIREELRNHKVRIVLRTGQPGRAPERDVVLRYEIDGYEVKTNLTAQALVTVVVAGLRAFDLIQSLERGRRGLEQIVDAAADLSRTRTLSRFGPVVLPQLEAILGVSADALFCAQRRASDAPGRAVVIAATGRHAMLVGRSADEVDTALVADVATAVSDGGGMTAGATTVLRLRSPHRRAGVLRIDARTSLSPIEEQLVGVFCTKIAVLLDNVHLLEQVSNAQRATVVALADLAEHRDTDTGGHVLRVARTTDLLARDLHEAGVFGDELDDVLLEQIGLASMLHDVGKVAVPDAVLLKPGGLDSSERAVMERHASVGAGILARADELVGEHSYIAVAAVIAEGHHEWFDGRGYPRGLAGSRIPLAARITAVADVFDALTSKRPYKDPWPPEEALAYIRGRAGTQFDPHVVASFERVYQSPAFRAPIGGFHASRTRADEPALRSAQE